MTPKTTIGETAAASVVWSALEQHDLQVESIELISVSENHTFAMRTADGQRYIARVHRLGYSSAEELESEHRWVEALDRAGFGTARPVRARGGAGHVEIGVGDGTTRQVGVLEWVDGPSMADAIDAGAGEGVGEGAKDTATRVGRQFEELGAQMARLHDFTESWDEPPGFTRRRWDLDGFFGAAPHWGRFWEVDAATVRQQRVFEAVRDRLGSELAAFGEDSDRFGLIHADLHMLNVLDTATGLVIIDFDDAGYGWHLYDMAVALHSQLRPGTYDTARGATVRGYRRHRPLPDEHLGRLPLFVLLRCLVNIGWAADRPELVTPAQLSTVIASGCERAERYLSGESPIGPLGPRMAC